MMCTALYLKDSRCFGRTLDLERTYGEQVTITPRRLLGNRYAIVGTATIADGYPLYYDGMNEMGLAIAGLNFPHSAHYPPPREGAENIAIHQLIPTLLGDCDSVNAARKRLTNLHLCNRPFSAQYPVATLHWMLADRERAMVIEATTAGVQVYENSVGAITNEPPFPQQLEHWRRFAALTNREPVATPPHLGRGSESLGLPGDFTSPSRFVRAAFAAAHATETDNPVGEFFHKMATVEVPRGAITLTDGQQAISHYTCCMDLEKGVYYCRTYGAQRIDAVALREPEMNRDELIGYPHRKHFDVTWEN